MKDRFAVAERRRLLSVERQEKAKAESEDASRRRIELLTLSALRGEEIDAPETKRGEASKPMRRQSGLDWLWSKQRIEPHQMSAGLKYGDVYRQATDISLRSCIADARGGDGLKTQEKRQHAQEQLAAARTFGLSDHEGLIRLVDYVAGEGNRITDLSKGDDTETKKNEAILGVALDHLAKWYGIVP